ncbi:helix-turn-helix domain-containing protein [Pedobacter sp. AW31-3R]|uniref:helix-turn-helix domain-containing protein n=1 Tax=Pedobacter sp. AW31-3R TaxID=3445781 RepID=UPI003FA153CE
MSKFRDNLRRLRVELIGSQHDLASKCNVQRSKISALETNSDANLNLTTLFELARGLGVHPSKLIDYPFDFE